TRLAGSYRRQTTLEASGRPISASRSSRPVDERSRIPVGGPPSGPISLVRARTRGEPPAPCSRVGLSVPGSQGVQGGRPATLPRARAHARETPGRPTPVIANMAAGPGSGRRLPEPFWPLRKGGTIAPAYMQATVPTSNRLGVLVS